MHIPNQASEILMPGGGDEIRWINNKFNVSLDYNQMRPVLSFCLIWAAVEAEAFGCYVKFDKIENVVKSVKPRLGIYDYEKYRTFLKNKYLRDSLVLNDLMDSFFPAEKASQRAKIESKMREVFIENTQNTETLVYALFLLAARVRNNLFHGLKEHHSLPGQTALFSMFNSFLAKFLEDYHKITPSRPDAASSTQ